MIFRIFSFFITLTFNMISKTLQILHLKPIIGFIIRKSLLYGTFTFFSFIILVKAYQSYVPNMYQIVKIQYHLIDGKYYAFIFDKDFKTICDQTQSNTIEIKFQESFLKFEKSYFCQAVIYEENNDLKFEDQYYQINFSIYAEYLMPNQKTIAEVTSYLIAENQINNFKQQNLIKLGDNYFISIFNFLPIRLLIKTYNKITELLDLNDSYRKRGQIDLFTHLPNQNTKIQAIILEMIAYEAAQFESEITFIPILKGLTYYLYYHFLTTFFYGTFILTVIFIFFWEVIFNINLWIIILKFFKLLLSQV